MYRKHLKRLLDLMLALAALLLLLPMLFILTVLLLFYYRGNPFFIQIRPGLNGRLFSLIKFRTMFDQRCEQGELLPDTHRLTTLGRFMRNTSLDELPQLLNVVIGDMSLIGPRPLLESYLPLYNTTQRRRHEVKPGITGWAQVNGRNAISWEEKFKYDVWYVDNVSFDLDLKILFITFKKLLIMDKSTITGIVPVQKFEGSPENRV